MPYDIAGNIVLPQPATSFMQGRALQLAQETRQAESQRAQESHELEVERAKLVFGKERATQLHAHVMQALSAPEGQRKQFVEENFPELRVQLEKRGLDWNGIDDANVTKMLKGIGARAAGEMGAIPSSPAPLSAEGKIATDVRAGILSEEQGRTALAPKSPSSYDEFVLAQKDPDFAKFLKERKAKGGLALTMPDGTTLQLGDVSEVGPGELSKPTINNLQETIVNSTNRLDRLNQTLKTYNPEFLRAKGLVNASTIRVKDFLGMNVPAEQKKFLSEYSEFQANAANDFNQTLKELSGVAVNAHELDRAKQAAPSGTDLSPTEFEAKARATTKFITRAIMRANWALKNGIGAKSVDQLAKMMPLEGVDQVYETRVNEIWQELGGKQETRAEAIKKANAEFGLAR